MVWIEFLISAAVITFAAMQLSKYGDVIGLRTKLGGAFAGTLLLAAATTLPELLTTVTSIRAGVPDLAAGNLFGSNMINIMLLAILDMVHYRRCVSRKNAEKHALAGSLTVLMIGLAIFFILADIPAVLRLGNFVVGMDGLTMIIIYLLAMSLLSKQSRQHALPVPAEDIPDDVPSLKTALAWFAGAVVVLVFATPRLVDASSRIAELTGLEGLQTVIKGGLTYHPKSLLKPTFRLTGAEGSSRLYRVRLHLSILYYCPRPALGRFVVFSGPAVQAY